MNKSDVTTPIANYFSGFAVADQDNFDFEKAKDLWMIQCLEFLKIPQDV